MDRTAADMIIGALMGPLDLANSYCNYHVHGVHYLCLGRSEGLTLKLYYINPLEARLNQDGWLVAPHDHRYDFTTWILSGELNHLRFEEAESYPSSEYLRHQHLMGSSSSQVWLTDPTAVRLRVKSNLKYSPGEHYWVTSDEIHTIAPNVSSGAEPVIMFLAQYDKVKDATRTYLHEERKALGWNPGLYLPMPRDMAEDIRAVATLSMRVSERSN